MQPGLIASFLRSLGIKTKQANAKRPVWTEVLLWRQWRGSGGGGGS